VTDEEGEIRLPARVGRYVLRRRLARGGTGVVYLAWQNDLSRDVAVKMVLAGEHAGRAERQQFETEARLAARLRHPNIVPVYEVEEHGGRPYLAMEYVEGGPLARYLGGRPLPVREAAELVAALAGAVQHAHDRSVLHRDLKPSNVLLQPVGRSAAAGRPFSLADFVPKITDFGLARSLDPDATRSARVSGTPPYMPPEQAEGRPAACSETADVYGLGAILYEALTGRPPFKGLTDLETLAQVKAREPIPPRRLNRAVPRDLQAVCLKCLEKKPKHRYPSAAALQEDLQSWLDGRGVKARRPWLLTRAWRWLWRRPAAAAPPPSGKS
jgi:serine/threonine-protein kinase